MNQRSKRSNRKVRPRNQRSNRKRRSIQYKKRVKNYKKTHRYKKSRRKTGGHPGGLEAPSLLLTGSNIKSSRRQRKRLKKFRRQQEKDRNRANSGGIQEPKKNMFASALSSLSRRKTLGKNKIGEGFRSRMKTNDVENDDDNQFDKIFARQNKVLQESVARRDANMYGNNEDMLTDNLILEEAMDFRQPPSVNPSTGFTIGTPTEQGIMEPPPTDIVVGKQGVEPTISYDPTGSSALSSNNIPYGKGYPRGYSLRKRSGTTPSVIDAATGPTPTPTWSNNLGSWRDKFRRKSARKRFEGVVIPPIRSNEETLSDEEAIKFKGNWAR